jgi:hypothetical protein
MCQVFLICVCYSGAWLPFPNGRVLQKLHKIKVLASETRS